MHQVESVPHAEVISEELSGPEEQLFGCIDVYPVDIDELTVKTGLPSGSLHDLLLRLELKGRIRQLPGQQYEKV